MSDVLLRAIHVEAANINRSAKAARAGFADGDDQMRVCDAVLSSARKGRWIVVKS